MMKNEYDDWKRKKEIIDRKKERMNERSDFE